MACPGYEPDQQTSPLPRPWPAMKQKRREAAAGAEEKFLAACSLSEQRRWRDAHKLFLAAAKAGHSGAQLNVGNLFYDGEGTRKSRHKALYWYRKAAAQGYGAAASNIGIVYKTVPSSLADASRRPPASHATDMITFE